MTRSMVAGLALVLAAALPAQAGPPGEAAGAVRRLHEALTQIGGRAGLDHVARTEALGAVVAQTHDLDRMAQQRLAGHWAQLDAEERDVVAERLGDLVAAAYTRDLTGPARFELLDESDGGSGTRIVRAAWTRADGSRHSLDYRLAATGGRWLVVDRLEDGRVPLPAQPAEVEALWSRGGVSAVISAWEAALPRGSTPPPNETATQVIARLHEALLGVMRQATQLGYRGRYERLDGIIRSTHYLPAIARLTIRRYWDGLQPAQQKEFFDTFAQVSVANYASKFDGFNGETFARLGEQQVGKSTVVRSALTKSNGEKVTFDYTMRQVKGRWRILNITVDGVSDLSTKQAEYGAVMASGGLPALLAKLRAQIRQYESGS